MSGKGKAVLAAVVTISAFAASCGKDSNTVAAPTNVNAMSVAGTWSGTFISNDKSCSNSPVTITIVQNGAKLTGNLANSSSCVPHGVLTGSISGNMVTGNIDMQGCTGGSISGQISGGVLSVSIGDFWKPLVTQNVIMQGGAAALRQ